MAKGNITKALGALARKINIPKPKFKKVKLEVEPKLRRTILSPTVFSKKIRQTIEEGKLKRKPTFFQQGRL